jgi:hypothetical protein
LAAPEVLHFASLTLEHCRRCNKPMEDSISGLVCAACTQLMATGVLDLETVAGDGRLAYVFLTAPALRGHAMEVGRVLLREGRLARAEVAWLGEASRKKLAAAPDLGPTELGLFEYLQAVLAMDDLRGDLEAGPAAIGVHRLAAMPELFIYVMPEARFLAFLEQLDTCLARMRLSVGWRALLCHSHTPIWSLMDRFASHVDASRWLVDISGGEMITFTDKEVAAIRRLAGADQRSVTRAQLQALIAYARQGASLEMMKLEIQRRVNKRKIDTRFASSLSEELAQLASSLPPTPSNAARQERCMQEKRALFIKNVADLGNFRAQ